MKMKKTLSIIFIFLALIFLSSCATIPERETLQSYHLNGATYYSLASLCQLKGISWQYDKLTKAVVLNKNLHKINLVIGDNIALIDGTAKIFNHPVEIYQGSILVPRIFKEQVLDVLFKETCPVRKRAFALSVIRKVVIDAGHGGYDPGTIGRSGLKEKVVNLDIAKRLANLLRCEGVEVIMTRATDKFIPLGTRVDIANRSGADLFISIHSNANRTRSLNGFEVYYVSPTVSDTERALRAAKNAMLRIEDASFASNSLNLRAILWDMIYTSNRAESIELARSLCKTVGSNLNCKILGVKGARYEVLRGARMPAVLIETGFLSNRDEERLLRDAGYRQKVAASILEGMNDYAQGLSLTEVAQR